MICKDCSSENETTSEFCSHCGNKLKMESKKSSLPKNLKRIVLTLTTLVIIIASLEEVLALVDVKKVGGLERYLGYQYDFSTGNKIYIAERNGEYFVVSNKETKPSKEYDIAVDTYNWCWKMPNSGGKYAASIRIIQLIGDDAIFKGKGYQLMMNKNQINGDIYKGKSLEDSAKYLGKVNDIYLNGTDGFPQKFEYFEVITKREFKAAKQSLGSTGCN
jgi:hypothetical protein